jgi:hypothetical protein
MGSARPIDLAARCIGGIASPIRDVISRKKAGGTLASLLKLSEMRSLEYQPEKDGFVFSTSEIHAAIDRQQRLQRALTTDFRKYKPRKFHANAA